MIHLLFYKLNFSAVSFQELFPNSPWIDSTIKLSCKHKNSVLRQAVDRTSWPLVSPRLKLATPQEEADTSDRTDFWVCFSRTCSNSRVPSLQHDYRQPVSAGVCISVWSARISVAPHPNGVCRGSMHLHTACELHDIVCGMMFLCHNMR